MQNSPITQAPSTLPAPPKLEDAKETTTNKIVEGSACFLIGTFCGLAASLPSLAGPGAAIAPMVLIGGTAAVLYKTETDKRVAERKVNQQYLDTIHQYLTNQPERSSSKVQTTRQEPPSKPTHV